MYIRIIVNWMLDHLGGCHRDLHVVHIHSYVVHACWLLQSDHTQSGQLVLHMHLNRAESLQNLKEFTRRYLILYLMYEDASLYPIIMQEHCLFLSYTIFTNCNIFMFSFIMYLMFTMFRYFDVCTIFIFSIITVIHECMPVVLLHGTF